MGNFVNFLCYNHRWLIILKKLPPQSTLGNSKCLKKGDDMVNAAFVDLRDKYIIPLLDHLLAKTLDGSKYNQTNAGLDLATMAAAVGLITGALDGLPGIFLRKKYG